jgi:predicted dehydrogenase
MAKSVIRVGLIGAGGNTRSRHIPGLKEQEGVEIVTVANRTPESAKKVADEFGIPRIAADWRAVLEDDGVDAVCIGTWPYMHAPLTIAALKAGKHVLCEARMAMNRAEAREMLRASREHPRQVAQIVTAPQTLPFDRTIAEMIGGGHIGELITIDARIALGSDFPKYESPLHWRHAREYSGNNIMGMGIWYEAMMRWVGPAATVHAVGRSVVPHRKDADGRRVAMTIPDHVDIIGRMEQGGQMRLNFTSVLGFVPKPIDIAIYGTAGTICLSGKPGETKLTAGKRGDDGLKEVAIDPAKRGGWRVEEEFINAIRGLEPVTHTDFATGVRYMEWTDAVTLSLKHGKAVALPLLED